VAHAILFQDKNLNLAHKHLFESVSYLEDFNDLTSSIVILDGTWTFYRDANFSPGPGVTLGPGVYNWVEVVAINNDSVSSAKVVG
jgi:beta/gamma crystallin